MLNNSLKINTIFLNKKEKSNSLTLQSKDKTMVRPGEPECIDIYWIEYVAADDGSILYIISETYLYTLCSKVGGGGGPEYSEWIPNFGQSVSVDIDNLDSSMEIMDGDTSLVLTKVWKYHDGGSWNIKSKEKISVSIKNNKRDKMKSIQHLSEQLHGGWLYGNVYIQNSNFNGIILMNNAVMNVDYVIRYEIKIGSNIERTYYSEELNSVGQWDIYFNKR